MEVDFDGCLLGKEYTQLVVFDGNFNVVLLAFFLVVNSDIVMSEQVIDLFEEFFPGFDKIVVVNIGLGNVSGNSKVGVTSVHVEETSHIVILNLWEVGLVLEF